MTYILILFLFFLLTYFIVRFYLIKNALKETNRKLKSIQKDIRQNHVLHLPMPDKDLEILMSIINDNLYEIRSERKIYADRERIFQSQIEAISHDLRTPLTVILGYLKLLQKQNLTTYDNFTDEQIEMIKTTVRKAEAMEKLISQFYDYSRLNANDFKMDFSELDISKLLREIFIDNCLIFENAELQVNTQFLDYPIWISGNEEALERAFVNLFQNISRYAHSYVKLEIKKEKNHVLIFFENDTNDLEERDIPNLFDRFYMKDMSRSHGGSGLGLTISRSLIEEMDGRLEASIPYKGTVCFTLSMPIIDTA